MSGENTNPGKLERPFWFRPPWAILFDLIRLQKVRPWDVKLSNLLNALIKEIRSKGSIDFPAAGIALFSSSTIYRRKTELILELQEPPTPPREKQAEFIPPPIQPPLRYEYTTTTIENLVEALEESLTNQSSIELQPRLVPEITVTPIIQEIDQFMIDIENKIEKMYQKISTFKNEIIPLSKLTCGLERLEVIRTLLLILFLACRDKIKLWQEKNFGEVFISILRCEQKVD